MRLQGKTAIVTGAGQGIGRAAALRLSGEGAGIAALDLNRETAERTAAEARASGGSALALRVDVTDAAQVEAAAAAVLAEFGRIDILVNCAGGGWRTQAEFKDTVQGEWRWIVDLNLNGTLHCTRAVVGHMVGRRYGKIVNVASIAAAAGIPRLAVYSATKGAVVSFTKALAMELGPHNINVNSVSPGLIAEGTQAPESDGTFLGRRGTPGEVASLIAFLASDEAAFITGADYLIDGGRILGPRGA